MITPTTLLILYLLFIVASCITGVVLVYRRIRFFQFIKDNPTINIRSAPQGLVEIKGKAVIPEYIKETKSPVSNKKCCWYKISVHEWRKGGYTHINTFASKNVFGVKDDTGECIVFPDIETDASFNGTTILYGDDPDPKKSIKSISGGNKKYKYIEYIINENDPIYAIGNFYTIDNLETTMIDNRYIRDIKKRVTKLDLFEVDHVEEYKEDRHIKPINAMANPEQKEFSMYLSSAKNPERKFLMKIAGSIFFYIFLIGFLGAGGFLIDKIVEMDVMFAMFFVTLQLSSLGSFLAGFSSFKRPSQVE